MAPTSDRIREIQNALIQADVYIGAPTGKWDAATIDAMKKFQQSNGLNPSGKLNALSLEKLGLGSTTAGRGAPRLAPPASTSSSPTTPRSK
jgi:peptidoglycan hydrolase-like protein with peptidoglycan-binding domain